MTSALPPSLTEPINDRIPPSHDPDNSRNCTARRHPLGDRGKRGTRVNSLSLGIYSLVKPLSASFPVNALLWGRQDFRQAPNYPKNTMQYKGCKGTNSLTIRY